MHYDRDKAVAYAHQWAFGRNPKFYDFSELGGDCTNFISQCIYEGCGEMNYARDVGWYYRSVNDRAAAWSGVEFLHRFLINNQGQGPHAKEMPLDKAQIGDVIQLSFDGHVFVHSLLIVNADDINDIRITTHTNDSDNRSLSTYWVRGVRLLHILD